MNIYNVFLLDYSSGVNRSCRYHVTPPGYIYADFSLLSISLTILNQPSLSIIITNNDNNTFFLFLHAKYRVISSYNSFISLFLGPFKHLSFAKSTCNT